MSALCVWDCWGYLGSTLANEQIMAIMAMGLLGLPQGYLWQRSKSWPSWLWDDWGYFGANLTNGQILAIIAMELLGLPGGYLCQ